MPKRALGRRTATGQADSQGINPYLPGTGWVVTFDPSVFASNLPELELYHIALDGPVGSSAVVLLDGAPWDYINQAWSNGWDPSQPMLIFPGVTVAICWNVAFTAGPYDHLANVQPTATLWLRHELPAPAQPLPGLGG